MILPQTKREMIRIYLFIVLDQLFQKVLTFICGYIFAKLTIWMAFTVET